MEILGYLDEQGKPGEILHGSMETIAKRLGVLLRVAKAKKKIAGMRLGAIGKPSGLISSEADAEKLKAASGMEIVELTLDELVAEYHKGGYPENELTQELKSAGYDSEEVEKALDVYGATCRIIERHDLQAVTIRCFELLDLIHTTGCLALAILNAQGIPAACEGDTKSLASMVILNAITGQSSFMANPSCMDDQTMEIVFAHCTLPIDMPEKYRLTTHFESGIGVAVAGDVPLGKVTVFKCNDTLTRHYAGRAELLECPHRTDLCRTQMRLKMLDGVDYFAHGPISNHHMIVKGDWADEINEFFMEKG
jgi:L-fucose isomerase-like protein